jgi:hypothetical protein
MIFYDELDIMTGETQAENMAIFNTSLSCLTSEEIRNKLRSEGFELKRVESGEPGE